MGRISIVLGILAATAGSAGADDRDAWRLDGGFGIRVGSQLVDATDVGTVVPIHLDAGVVHERIRLYGEYSFAELTFPHSGSILAEKAGLTSGSKGLEQRIGANARYSFGREGKYDGGGDLWVEGGLGFEHYQWDAGGAMNRPDIALGIGASTWGQGHKHHGGLSIGLRVTLSRRNDVSAGAATTCAGPCDYATTPTGWDRSFMFDTTFMFGK